MPPLPVDLVVTQRTPLHGQQLHELVSFSLHVVIGISEQAILISFCVHFPHLVSIPY